MNLTKQILLQEQLIDLQGKLSRAKEVQILNVAENKSLRDEVDRMHLFNSFINGRTSLERICNSYKIMKARGDPRPPYSKWIELGFSGLVIQQFFKLHPEMKAPGGKRGPKKKNCSWDDGVITCKMAPEKCDSCYELSLKSDREIAIHFGFSPISTPEMQDYMDVVEGEAASYTSGDCCDYCGNILQECCCKNCDACEHFERECVCGTKVELKTKTNDRKKRKYNKKPKKYGNHLDIYGNPKDSPKLKRENGYIKTEKCGMCEIALLHDAESDRSHCAGCTL